MSQPQPPPADSGDPATPPPTAGKTRFAGTVEISDVHSNTTQEVIEITEDRLRLRLLEHSNQLQKSRDWQTPLGLLVGIVLTLLTADFRDSLWVPKATWHALFLLGAGVTLIWLVNCIRNAVRKPSIDELVTAIKKQQLGKDSQERG